MKLEQTVIAALTILSFAAPLHADSVERGSSAASLASGASVAAGAIALSAVAGTQMVVSGLDASGEVVKVSLKGASELGAASINVTRQAVEASGLAVGTSVRVVAESAGYAIFASAVMIAYLPSEIGRSLLHHTRHGGVTR